jgi:hypothetical protein
MYKDKNFNHLSVRNGFYDFQYVFFINRSLFRFIKNSN